MPLADSTFLLLHPQPYLLPARGLTFVPFLLHFHGGAFHTKDSACRLLSLLNYMFLATTVGESHSGREMCKLSVKDPVILNFLCTGSFAGCRAGMHALNSSGLGWGSFHWRYGTGAWTTERCQWMQRQLWSIGLLSKPSPKKPAVFVLASRRHLLRVGLRGLTNSPPSG